MKEFFYMENKIIDKTKNIKYNIIDYKIRKKIKIKDNFITRNEIELRKKLALYSEMWEKTFVVKNRNVFIFCLNKLL